MLFIILSYLFLTHNAYIIKCFGLNVVEKGELEDGSELGCCVSVVQEI